ncbi:hypothetical protein ACN20G_00150 [Streptomyces sp. BI20]|uniref:hypothetical protein n=1 Tax=Streptomyces sp. BI20 TaxID=3403460 RepID=UPI003C7803AE
MVAEPGARPGAGSGRIVLVEPAVRQVGALDAAETRRVDAVLGAIAADPGLGRPIPETLLCDHVDPGTGVRVVYYATALRSLVLVVYVEV